MFEHGKSRRKQRPVTVLAVLFGLLLGLPGAAHPSFESNRAQLGGGALVRVAPGLRTAARSGEEKRDTDRAPTLLSASPRIVTLLLSSRPEAAPAPIAIRSADLERHVSYRARAPPAA